MRKFLYACTALFLTYSSNIAQTEIKGIVTDARDGLPMSGVSVRFKENNAGIQTDMNETFLVIKWD
jgi:hypothetical protein